MKIFGKVASADTEGVDKFHDELDKIIGEGGYSPQQILNIDGIVIQEDAKENLSSHRR